MDPTEAQVEVRRILDSSLGELTGVPELTGLDALTGAGGLGVRPAADPDSWDLPEPDRAALWRYGLPPARDDELTGVAGWFQAGREPELDEGGTRLYQLAKFGDATLAAAAGAGTVLAIPAFREVHPQLRHLHPDGILPVVANSSAARLVDLAWRWHWLLPVLVDQRIQARQKEAAAVEALRATGTLPDIFAGVRALSQELLERFRSIDPEAVPDGDSFWGETVREVGDPD